MKSVIRAEIVHLASGGSLLVTSSSEKVHELTTLRVTVVLKTNEGGRWIIPHVQEMLRRGYEVTLIIPPGTGRLARLLREHNVKIIPSAFDFEFRPHPSTLWGLLRLRGQIIQSAPNVIHYHLYASALAARLSTFALQVPKVHMVAGPLYLDSAKIRMVERLLMWTDTVLVAGSEHTARRYHSLGLPRRRLRTIPYGVDINHFRPPSAKESAAARSELGLKSTEFVAVMIAYVYGPKKLVHAASGIKGHDLLLEAWRQFSANKTGVKLILVGEGFDSAGEAHRKQLMSEYSSDSQNVRFVEQVQDVRPYYWASDVSVSPSLSENHGAALEAGACGVTRIVSDAGGLPETTDERSGWVVPRGSVRDLVRALEEAHREFLQGTLATKGVTGRQETVQAFDAMKSAARLIDVLAEAATGGQRLSEPQVTLVSEARLGTTSSGQIAAVDAASAASAWVRYAERIPGFKLAARTNKRAASADVPLGGVPVESLHYYHGLRQCVMSLPWLMVELSSIAQRSAALVVRLPGPLGFLAFILGRIWGKPIFVEVVGDPATVLGDSKSPRLRLLARPARSMMKYCVRRAAGSRFVTETTLQGLYPPKKGAPTFTMSNVRLDDSDYNPHLELPVGKSWRLTAIGTQETNYKGHDVALKALRRLADQGYQCHLLLVGQGALHEDLKDLAKKLGVAQQVEFRKRYDKKYELHEILEATDILLHPSRSEGLPRVVIEAMARSRPVVATRVGGIPELIMDSFLVEPSSPEDLVAGIRQLIDNPQRALVAGRANHSAARRYHYGRLSEVFDRWCQLIAGTAISPKGSRRLQRGN